MYDSLHYKVDWKSMDEETMKDMMAFCFSSMFINADIKIPQHLVEYLTLQATDVDVTELQ